MRTKEQNSVPQSQFPSHMNKGTPQSSNFAMPYFSIHNLYTNLYFKKYIRVSNYIFMLAFFTTDITLDKDLNVHD